jgi:hypothetical protein
MKENAPGSLTPSAVPIHLRSDNEPCGLPSGGASRGNARGTISHLPLRSGMTMRAMVRHLATPRGRVPWALGPWPLAHIPHLISPIDIRDNDEGISVPSGNAWCQMLSALGSRLSVIRSPLSALGYPLSALGPPLSPLVSVRTENDKEGFGVPFGDGSLESALGGSDVGSLSSSFASHSYREPQ